MLLAIDIGNTNIVMAVFRGKRMVKMRRITTDPSRKKGAYRSIIHQLIGKAGACRVDGVIVSSVVPKVTAIVKQALLPFYKGKLYILGENAEVPIANKYRRPRQVGQDRLVNAFAVCSLYKRTPAIIIDFGTAVTIDVISRDGAYLGGIIVPGVELSIDNLTEHAALLPAIRLRKPKDVLGRSTSESMLSGIFYGYASLCDGMVGKLARKFKHKVFVLATGGHAQLLSSYCTTIHKIDPGLTLKGLNAVYTSISKNS